MKGTKKKHQLLSILLSCMLVVGLMPNVVFAETNVDTTGPVIESVELSSEEVSPGDILKVTVTVSDESEIKNVTVGYTKGLYGGSGKWLYAEKQEEGVYVAEIEITDAFFNDYYSISTDAEDIYGNTASVTQSAEVLVTGGIDDVTGPVIESVELSSEEVSPGDILKVTVTVSDESEIKNVTVGYTKGLYGGSGKWLYAEKQEEGVYVAEIEITDAFFNDYYSISTDAEDIYGNTASVVRDAVFYVGHCLEKIEKQEATCLENGHEEYWRCSICRALFSDAEGNNFISEIPVINALGHNWDEDYTLDKEATCTEEGSKSIHCSACNATKDVTAIDKIAHEYGEWIIDEKATCTEEGSKHRECGNCDATESGIIEATGHSWNDDYTVDKAASCTEEGSKSIHCSACDATKDVTAIDKIAHEYGEWIIDEKATCTEEGSKHRECGNCDATESGIIEATGHSWDDDYTVDKAASCTEEGSKSIHCSACDATKDVTAIDKIAHEYGEWIIDEKATCTEAGSKHRECENCDATESGTVEAAGHSWDDDYTVDKVASCTEEGSKSIHCSACDATKDVTAIDKIAHEYGEWIIDEKATCTEAGSKHRECENCDATESGTVEAAGHSWDDDYTVDKVASCTEEGSKSIHCSACNATKDVRTINSLGHEYESETSKATISANGSVVTKCSVCGDVKDTTTIYYPKTMKLQATTYTYNGGVKTPAVSIADANGNTVSSDNYSVSYASGRKSVGKYKVTVTFKGDKYSGFKYTYFYINPKGTTISKVYGAKKAFTVKWKKQSSKMATSTITGYQIRYSTSSKMTSAKIKTIKGYKYTSKKITKLSAKKKYYVQVRTYKTVSGKTYYSTWSSIKSVKTK